MQIGIGQRRLFIDDEPFDLVTLLLFFFILKNVILLKLFNSFVI